MPTGDPLYDIYCVDSFSKVAFAGNPAGVCITDGSPSAGWMQKVATELNLSETAFVHKTGKENYQIRFFSPLTEVDLCGHATLACGHLLLSSDGACATFQAKHNSLHLTRQAENIVMKFPSTPPVETGRNDSLQKALGLLSDQVHGLYRAGDDLMVHIGSAELLAEIRPDFSALADIRARGIIVTAEGDLKTSHTPADFVSRFFAPAIGINEDPVTGSSHCALAPFWNERLGKKRLFARQLSSRGGEIVIETGENPDSLFIKGTAVTIWCGKINRV